MFQEERMASANESAPKAAPLLPHAVPGQGVLLFVTILVVWMIYAYLHAFRLDWLGWFYSKLLPLTNALYALVETYFPGDVKYKTRGAITDDLGQRSIFLLLLTATVELRSTASSSCSRRLSPSGSSAAPRRRYRLGADADPTPLADPDAVRRRRPGRRRRGFGRRTWPGRASRQRAGPACRHRRPG